MRRARGSTDTPTPVSCIVYLVSSYILSRTEYRATSILMVDVCMMGSAVDWLRYVFDVIAYRDWLPPYLLSLIQSYIDTVHRTHPGQRGSIRIRIRLCSEIFPIRHLQLSLREELRSDGTEVPLTVLDSMIPPHLLPSPIETPTAAAAAAAATALPCRFLATRYYLYTDVLAHAQSRLRLKDLTSQARRNVG